MFHNIEQLLPGCNRWGPFSIMVEESQACSTSTQPPCDPRAGFGQLLSPLPLIFFGAELGKPRFFHLTKAPCDSTGCFSLSISLWTNRSHLKWMSGREKGGEQIPYSPLVREILGLPALRAQFPDLKAVPFTSQQASPPQAAGCSGLGWAYTPFLCMTKNSSLQKKWEQTHRVPPKSFHLNVSVFFHLQKHFVKAFRPIPFCGL